MRKQTIKIIAIGCIYVLGLDFSKAIAVPLSVTADNVTITRGDWASLSCSASGGCPPYTYKWTDWTKGNARAVKKGPTVNVMILESCSVTITVTDSKDSKASGNVAITVLERKWDVVHATQSDAWTDWGGWPLSVLGDNINANNHGTLPIIGETSGDWKNQINRIQISDADGPFDGCWYNSDHSLRVERETRICQYLKANGTSIPGGNVRWTTLQNGFATNSGSYSPVVSASEVCEGVKYHENQGKLPADFNKSPKEGGHSALFKKKQDSDPKSYKFNAARQIEKLYSKASEDALQKDNNDAILPIDKALFEASRDPLTGNLKTHLIYDYNYATTNYSVTFTDQ